jgi:archaemetzincin
VSLGFVEPGLLHALATRLAARGFQVALGGERAVPSDLFDGRRRQWRAEPLLSLLSRKPGGRVLGVTELDLYAEGTRFVFGIGQRPGRAAVVSLHHLRSHAGAQRVLARAFKEAIHELGHGLGLPNCANTRCVMLASQELADTDRKSSEPCRRCSPAWSRVLGRRAGAGRALARRARRSAAIARAAAHRSE